MPSPRQRRGTQGEEQAADFLRAQGFTILESHVTSRYGEIDILMQDSSTTLTTGSDTIVAVEVKTRRTAKFGRAIEAMTNSKLQKISDALQDILSKRGWLDRPYRIDVVTIEPSGIEHLKGVGPDNA